MRSNFWLYLVATVLIGGAVFALVRVINGPEIDIVTTTVERGAVEELVSVSGVIEAENTAELAFPVSGIVESVLVYEGEHVEAGQNLAALERNSLLADRREALAALQIAEADRSELIAGPRNEERAITQTSVESAEENLVRVTREEQEKVDNARRKLLSSDLEAFPINKKVSNTAPTITGTYTCEDSGEYELEMFASNARSGYSYRLSGLESGTDTAYTSSASSLGACGLKIQFTAGSQFGTTDWRIPVPNPNGSAYTTNLNAYELAVEQRNNQIAEAEEALNLARQEQVLENAAPRSEALSRADAAVLQAQARLSSVDSALSDRVLKAPFAGTVTNVEILAGETVSTQAVITLLSESDFELTARIPEIDIAKVNAGQSARVTFDAQPEETLETEIKFVSPLATEIDGVAYFEAKLQFADTPVWLRSGLNADVDILVDSKNDTFRLPKRFVTTRDSRHFVLLEENGEVIEQEIGVGFSGNDGFIEVIGLKEGDLVIAP